jgi:hypothetical protein
MATDPSWLYSTIAQSSAAIVAIIGGFITATILRLSAEKESLTKEIDIKRKRIDLMKKSHVDVTVVNFKDLEDEIPILENRVQKFSFPSNLKWGVIILGYLTLFCIFLPIMIISMEAFSAWSKYLTLYSFYVGILLLFTYIIYQIRTIRRPPHDLTPS